MWWYHVTFDIDHDLDYTLDVGCSGDHRVQVWSRSSHMSGRRSDLRKMFTDSQTDRWTTDVALCISSWNRLNISDLPQKSLTQLRIATYRIFTIQKLLCKQMSVCHDLVSTVYVFLYTYIMTLCVLFRVFYVLLLCTFYVVYLCGLTHVLINATYLQKAENISGEATYSLGK